MRGLQMFGGRSRTVTKYATEQWKVVLAFFLGGAVSSLAQDFSDTAFFYATAHGWLTSATNQAIFWYDVPFALYFAFFLVAVGFMLAHFRWAGPASILYIFLAMVAFSTVQSLLLPQSTSKVYVVNVIAGTFISFGIVIGLIKEVKGSGSRSR